jgi:nucleoid DNA-binding protein
MNLRQWARLTQRALREQPPEDRSSLSIDQVEQVLRMGITTLAEALADGQDLRIVLLGQIKVEERPPRKIASNLRGKSQLYKVGRRKTIKLKASNWLIDKLNSSRAQPR